MMFSELNAAVYEPSSLYYRTEFEDILSKIVLCYDLMILDNVRLTNDENAIRNVLLINYLKNNRVRNKVHLTDYLFDREVPEDATIGRTDIKIQTVNTFKDTQAYYIIECKRLSSANPTGITGLNAKYIQSGISRFVESTYSTYYKTNGMIGFLVDDLDIDQNIGHINTLLKSPLFNITTNLYLNKLRICPFEFSYSSTHMGTGKEILIYHLMLDFSKSIAEISS